jgi:hypothetical protein
VSGFLTRARALFVSSRAPISGQTISTLCSLRWISFHLISALSLGTNSLVARLGERPPWAR